MVGFEPTTQKPMCGLSTTSFVKELEGILVRLTTCKGPTNCLPKLRLMKHIPARCRSVEADVPPMLAIFRESCLLGVDLKRLE